MRTEITFLSKVRDSSSRMMYHGPWGTPGEPGSQWEAGEAERGFKIAYPPDPLKSSRS